MMTAEQLQRRLDRERAARKEAERLLERRSSELYQVNQELLGVNQRLEQQAVELVAAHQAALESARLKSQFLANMSHEIRTPMNGVLGMLNLLLDSELADGQRDFAETARRSADSLLQIINDILDFSRIEAGKLVLEEVEFELRAEIEDCLDLLSEKAAKSGLGLWCEADPALPQLVLGDPGRLRQVLINLVGNALKFTHKGDVTLRVSMVAGENPVRARFEVVDTGIGISAEQQARLFRPFIQADGTTTRKYGGTGLGLSIARELVRLMGGEMGVMSDPGRGSTFWFEIPMVVMPAVAMGVDRALLRGRKVLVLDDDATNRAVLQHLLKVWEMAPVATAGAVEALEMLLTAEAEGAPFVLAIVDMQMPDVDGIVFANMVREEAALQELELILLSSNGPQRVSRSLARGGFAAHLSKPVRETQLLLALQRALGKEARPAGEVDEAAVPGAPSGRILIADDNRVNQKVAAHFLQRFGYQTETVANGVEAVEAARSGAYGLILMDCHMPLMDGFAATAAIRALDSELRNLPIVAVTANAMKGDRERCLEAGMNGYLSKPFRPQELRETIERYLGGGVVVSPNAQTIE